MSPTPNKTGTHTIEWDAATDLETGIGGYDIYRDGNLLASVGPTVLSFTDSGRPEGTFSYTIRAKDKRPGTPNVSGHSAAAVAVVDKTAPFGIALFTMAPGGTGTASAATSRPPLPCFP